MFYIVQIDDSDIESFELALENRSDVVRYCPIKPELVIDTITTAQLLITGEEDS